LTLLSFCPLLTCRLACFLTFREMESHATVNEARTTPVLWSGRLASLVWTRLLPCLLPRCLRGVGFDHLAGTGFARPEFLAISAKQPNDLPLLVGRGFVGDDCLGLSQVGAPPTNPETVAMGDHRRRRPKILHPPWH